MSAPDTLVATASGKVYFVFSMLCAAPIAVVVAAPLVGRPPQWEVVAVAGSLWLFALAWLLRFRIELSPTELRYRSLFSGTRRLPRADIANAEVEVGGGGGLAPKYRLVVTPRAPSSERPIVVNMKVFEPRSLVRVLEALHVRRWDAGGEHSDVVG